MIDPITVDRVPHYATDGDTVGVPARIEQGRFAPTRRAVPADGPGYPTPRNITYAGDCASKCSFIKVNLLGT